MRAALIAIVLVLLLPMSIEASKPHLYGVRRTERAPAGYVIHRQIPKWAVYGNGWLRHWQFGVDENGKPKWWQKRMPRPRPPVCYT